MISNYVSVWDTMTSTRFPTPVETETGQLADQLTEAPKGTKDSAS